MEPFFARILETCARRDRRTAFIVDGSEHTFADVGKRIVRARDVAAKLLAHGDGARSRVIAVCADRSADCVAAIVGIMAAGAVYMPIDPAYPQPRVRAMLDDARPLAVIADSKYVDRFDGVDVRCLDRVVREGAPGAEVCAYDGVPPLYLLYTSGSSGRPKGVLGTRAGLVNRVDWMLARHPFADDDVCCQRTSIGFVDSICEIVLPLVAGVASVIVSEEVGRDAGALAQLLERTRVTRITLVPTLLAMLVDTPGARDRLRALRLCVSSGEELPKELALRALQAFPACKLLNIYGSAEVAADVTSHEVTLADATRPAIPLGEPLPNVDIVLLDDARKPVNDGETGEIYVLSDDAVADGYVHADADEKFLANDFLPTSAHRKAYRTGDLGRRVDGALLYIGRRDLVVKLAGRKIHPHEIERLGEGVVVVARPVAGKSKLVAFTASHGDDASAAERLRAFHTRACAELPEHMIPAFSCALAELPLTTSGKVNRSALETIDGATFRVWGDVGGEPVNSLERHVKQCFIEFLGVEDVGTEMTFFEAGGTSAEVPALLCALNRFFTRQITAAELYRSGSVRALVSLVAAPARAGGEGIVVPFGDARSGPPLICVHPAGGLSFCYRALAAALPSTTVLGLDAPAFGAEVKPYRTVRELAAAYVDAIRPHHGGRLSLLGWSFGGDVAFEMAVQLAAAGVDVERVLLVDARREEHAPAARVLEDRQHYFLRNGITLESPLARDMLREMTYHDAIASAHVPSVYARGRVTLLKTTNGGSPDPTNGWQPYCAAGISVVPIGGEHDYLFDAWFVDDTCARIAEALASGAS